MLHTNLKGFVSPATWTRVAENKPYIVCFPQIGLQLREEGGLFETKLLSGYQDPNQATRPEEQLAGGIVDSTIISPMPSDAPQEEEEIDEISLDDLDVKKYEEKYEDGTQKLGSPSKTGSETASTANTTPVVKRR